MEWPVVLNLVSLYIRDVVSLLRVDIPEFQIFNDGNRVLASREVQVIHLVFSHNFVLVTALAGSPFR